MKWRKETQVYMYAHYYSEDGNWKAFDENILIPGGSRNKYFNKETGRLENYDSWKHIWKLESLATGEVIAKEFKTLKAAKEYAEQAGA